MHRDTIIKGPTEALARDNAAKCAKLLAVDEEMGWTYRPLQVGPRQWVVEVYDDAGVYLGRL